MIIACPECSSPFELRDGDVAELVQLECPHCRFRMILDFAAANDPRLVEVGMKMASGYRSASDYRAAVAPRAPLHAVDEPAAAQAEAARAAELEAARGAAAQASEAEVARIATAQAESTRAAEAARASEAARTAEAARVAAQAAESERVARAEATRAAAEAEAARATARAAEAEAARISAAREADAARVVAARDAEISRAAREAAWDDDEAAPTRIVSRPAVEPATTPAASAPSSRAPRTGETVVGPAPTRPSDETTAPAQRQDARRDPTSDRAAERPARVDDEARAAKPRRAEPMAISEPADDLDLGAPRKSGGVLGALLLALLLVLALGVTIASVIRKGTPDPRPLLEDVYRQYLKP